MLSILLVLVPSRVRGSDWRGNDDGGEILLCSSKVRTVLYIPSLHISPFAERTAVDDSSFHVLVRLIYKILVP